MNLPKNKNCDVCKEKPAEGWLLCSRKEGDPDYMRKWALCSDCRQWAEEYANSIGKEIGEIP